MYKLFFIAKNNMKKQKGDMITFFILTKQILQFPEEYTGEQIV